MRRIALIVLAVLFVAPTVAGGAVTVTAAQNGTATPSPTPTPNATATETPEAGPSDGLIDRLSNERSSPYNYTWLSSSPTIEYPDRDKSLRALRQPARSFVYARYDDPSLINALMGSQPPDKELAPDSLVRVNQVQLFASTEGEYKLVTVYWSENRTRANTSEFDGPVPYAHNQTVERRQITFEGDELYQVVNVSLIPHFDRTVQVTMWLENEQGERVAKWTFKHRTNPQFQSSPVNSLLGKWAFAFRNALLPAVGFGLLGMFGAKATLEGWGPIKGTARGPGYGTVTWAILIGFIAMFLVPSAGFYYQLAVVIENAPWIMGLIVGGMTYAYRLTDHNPVRTVGFLRRELFDSRSFNRPRPNPDERGPEAVADGGAQAVQQELGGSGHVFEELTDAFYSELPELPIAKSGGTYKVVPPGLTAFLAAMFVGREEFDPEAIGTREIVRNGRIDDIIHIDPGVGHALIHEKERLVNALPWTVLKKEYADREADPTWQGKAVAAGLTLLILLGPPVGLWVAFGQLWNIAPLGAAIGVVVTAMMALTAEQGELEFAPAPVHYRPVEQHLPALRRGYKQSKESETSDERARRLQAMTTKEAREDKRKEQQTFVDVLIGDADLAEDGGEG